MKTCRCGCGQEIAAHANYVIGHHWKVKRREQGVPDAKVCEGCGRMYLRSSLPDPQSNKHWLERQFCSDECRREAMLTLDPAAPEKQCPKCQRMLPKSEFWRSSKTRDGLQSKCKDCIRVMKKKLAPEVQRDRNLRQFYGIGADDYDRLLTAQGSVCAICRQPERLVRKGQVMSLAVDHCHETKKVRGLLCCACNQTLGKMDNDPERLRAAAAYLEQHA